MQELFIFRPDDLLLITGATGLVGSHVAQRARELGVRTRALVRTGSDTALLDRWGVEIAAGDLTDPASLAGAAAEATLVVHCAAKRGHWGPLDDFRRVNVQGLEHLLLAVEATGALRHLVVVSSLGVYEGCDHHGSDETVEPRTGGIDVDTITKIESEKLVLQHIAARGLRATIVRPGCLYGPRDRTVVPELLERLKTGQVRYFGSGEKLMNNTFVGNLVDVIFSVLEKPHTVGEVFNITDGELISKRDFISSVATLAGYEVPRAAVPLAFARFLAAASEAAHRALGRKRPPQYSQARFKFLGLNLDFSIEKARRELDYQPRVSFREGMRQTIDWFRQEGKL